jgi:hypothetical protein
MGKRWKLTHPFTSDLDSLSGAVSGVFALGAGASGFGDAMVARNDIEQVVRRSLVYTSRHEKLAMTGSARSGEMVQTS